MNLVLDEIHSLKRIKSMRKAWMCANCSTPLPVGSSGGRCFTDYEPHQLCSSCMDIAERIIEEKELDDCWVEDYKF